MTTIDTKLNCDICKADLPENLQGLCENCRKDYRFPVSAFGMDREQATAVATQIIDCLTDQKVDTVMILVNPNITGEEKEENPDDPSNIPIPQVMSSGKTYVLGLSGNIQQVILAMKKDAEEQIDVKREIIGNETEFVN